jgi:uncharacterized glyoxalase superfamily protein PhnB
MTIHAAIRYDDPDAALDWLCRAFGFTARDVVRDDAGTVVHAVLAHGTGTVLLSGPREPGWLGGAAAAPLASPISLYVVVDDPVAHHDRAVAEGAAVVRDLARMDYGSHEYSCRDLAGNLWSFGTYRP